MNQFKVYPTSHENPLFIQFDGFYIPRYTQDVAIPCGMEVGWLFKSDVDPRSAQESDFVTNLGAVRFLLKGWNAFGGAEFWMFPAYWGEAPLPVAPDSSRSVWEVERAARWRAWWNFISPGRSCIIAEREAQVVVEIMERKVRWEEKHGQVPTPTKKQEPQAPMMSMTEAGLMFTSDRANAYHLAGVEPFHSAAHIASIDWNERYASKRPDETLEDLVAEASTLPHLARPNGRKEEAKEPKEPKEPKEERQAFDVPPSALRDCSADPEHVYTRKSWSKETGRWDYSRARKVTPDASGSLANCSPTPEHMPAFATKEDVQGLRATMAAMEDLFLESNANMIRAEQAAARAADLAMQKLESMEGHLEYMKNLQLSIDGILERRLRGAMEEIKESARSWNYGRDLIIHNQKNLRDLIIHLDDYGCLCQCEACIDAGIEFCPHGADDCPTCEEMHKEEAGSPEDSLPGLHQAALERATSFELKFSRGSKAEAKGKGSKWLVVSMVIGLVASVFLLRPDMITKVIKTLLSFL